MESEDKTRPASRVEILIVIALIALACTLFVKYCAYAPDPYQEYKQQRLKNEAQANQNG